mmetsp:Transcript_66786/g.159792  ORF Transcript_66786/g.159792 Transcript_66786/m.159792 type:complete len:81 (+) Transcript_66786:872-1114(+)
MPEPLLALAEACMRSHDDTLSQEACPRRLLWPGVTKNAFEAPPTARERPAATATVFPGPAIEHFAKRLQSQGGGSSSQES